MSRCPECDGPLVAGYCARIGCECEETCTPPDTQAPTTDDPLHPTGRCTCVGEGTCEWCLRTDTGTLAREALEALLGSEDVDADLAVIESALVAHGKRQREERDKHWRGVIAGMIGATKDNPGEVE